MSFIINMTRCRIDEKSSFPSTVTAVILKKLMSLLVCGRTAMETLFK